MKVNIRKYPKGGIGKRNAKVTIESHDLYSLDCTLNVVIAPALHAFIGANHSAPVVELKDVPYELWPGNDPKWLALSDDDKIWKTDKFFFDRWDYVLKEMYFAFARVEYPNTTFDTEIYKYDDRVTNGLRLFAKYYQHLWI